MNKEIRIAVKEATISVKEEGEVVFEFEREDWIKARLDGTTLYLHASRAIKLLPKAANSIAIQIEEP